jgi:endo-1,4-beta-xylanase
MLKKEILLLLQFIAVFSYAQGAYHTSLQNDMKTNFNLSTFSWVLPNTEELTMSTENSSNYGGSTTSITVTGQKFTKAYRRNVTKGSAAWDAATLFKGNVAISKGDYVLIAVWLKSDRENVKVGVFAENNSTYEKETYIDVIVNKTWQLYLIPFTMKNGYASKAMNYGVHYAYQDNVTEVGGFAVMNFKTSIPFNQLPVSLNNPLYEGHLENAPWRAQAEADINLHRKANITVALQNRNPGETYTVDVEMQKHLYKWGTAVVSNKFNQTASGSTYEQKLLNLDGKGHGFNEVVFENDFKWQGWEGNWYSPKADKLQDVEWLKNKGIAIRGHTLSWPSWDLSPADVNQNATPKYVRDRQIAHINTMLSPSVSGGKFDEWDVINELTNLHDYANHFKGKDGYITGREFYADIFKAAKKADPSTKLYINDYVAIEKADDQSNQIALWQSYIDEIIKLGGPIEGIGLQGHFSTSPTGINTVKNLINQFWNKYKLPLKLTEYDFSLLGTPELQAKYMNDILHIWFSHPATEGFLMWGFWDGTHWLNNSPVYNTDWSVKPSGKVFIDNVFTKWWSNKSYTTSTGQNLSSRMFKGVYNITVKDSRGNVIHSQKNVSIPKDTTFNINLMLTSTEESADDIKIFPNPTKDIVKVEGANPSDILYTYDITGKLVDRSSGANGYIDLSQKENGIYYIKLMRQNKLFKMEKVYKVD